MHLEECPRKRPEQAVYLSESNRIHTSVLTCRVLVVPQRGAVGRDDAESTGNDAFTFYFLCPYILIYNEYHIGSV